MSSRVRWECPKCSAIPNSHGNGGRETCKQRPRSSFGCDGFLCECDGLHSVDHGETYVDPCRNAVCHHCGWSGVFPRRPKGLTPWESLALAAGWTPPAARATELGIVASERAEARGEVAALLRHGGPVTDDVLALAEAIGLREGKHTTSSVATHALAEIKRLRAAKEAK